MASKGNPIIVTAGATWVVTGDQTICVERAIWRGYAAADVIRLDRNSDSAAVSSGTLTTYTASTAETIEVLPPGTTISKLYVHTLGGGKLEIWEK